jgi:hypothetical protein
VSAAGILQALHSFHCPLIPQKYFKKKRAFALYAAALSTYNGS